MKPPFLSNDRIYIRAMVLEDKDCAVAWFNSEFPVNAVRAEKFLRDNIKESWGARRRKYFAVVRAEDDQVIGGIKLKSRDMRAADLTFKMAPHLSPEEADQYKAEALRLFVPWIRDEHEYMAQTIEIAADEPACIAAAEEMDLYFGVRFRGYLRRPGGRIDMLVYQALNPKWEVVNA
jgi:RimJ/RimL family protein N-acetyltransferase